MSDVMEAVRIVRFDKDARLEPAPQSAGIDWVKDGPGNFRAGLWTGKPGRAEIHYKKNELCTLLEGEVRLTDAAGHVETFHAGDTFLIPYGFKGVWETVQTVRKFYAVHEKV